MCLAVDVETTHSERILSFLHVWIWWMRQSNFSDCFSSSFFKIEDLQLPTLHILVFFFSKTSKSTNMPISARKREHPFFKNKRLFLHYKCCTYQNICFFLPSGWNYIYIYIYSQLVLWINENTQCYMILLWV